MKNTEKEKWIDDVLSSMKGSERAAPSRALYTKIEKQIMDSRSLIVLFEHWRSAAAAAVIILTINGIAINKILAENQSSNQEQSTESSYSPDLITDYKLY